MLRALRTKCFRQHKSNEWVFGTGMVVIRGANEAGKSNLLAAAMYALGGSKTLSKPLADVVTWGHDERELKVEAEIEVEGTLYTFTRSAAGAECNYVRDGEPHKVVGQAEVTRYACELLGAPNIQTLSRLMLVKQNAIRGALDEGETKVAEQIEVLANFDYFEKLYKRIEKHWVTGPTRALEQRAEQLRDQLRSLQMPAPDLSAQTAQIEALQGEIEAARTTLATEAQVELDAANAAFQTVNEHIRLRAVLIRAYDAALCRSSALETQWQQVQQVLAAPPDAARLEDAGRELAAALDQQQRLTLYRRVKALMDAYPAQYWEGDAASLAAELSSLQAQLNKITAEAGKLDGDLRVAQSQIVTGSLCGYCGQDWSQFPEIAARNAALTQQIDRMRQDLTHLEQVKQSVRDQITALERIADMAKPYAAFTLEPEWVVRDEQFVPCRLIWQGAPPTEQEADTEALRLEIERLREQAAQFDKASIEAGVLRPQLDEAQQQVRAARAALEAMPEKTAHAAYQRLADAKLEVDSLQQQIACAEQEIRRLEQHGQHLAAEYAAVCAQRRQIEQQLEQLRVDIEQQAFHTALLKKVREARPAIADQLWNRILEAVSVTVTQMRGQPSVVTKNGGGFRLNGRDVQDYSGSTLDVIGLAIRTALVQTFLPHVQMLVLDEASAACDDARTAAMVAYLAASGFEQTILITHDDVAESMADQLIQL